MTVPPIPRRTVARTTQVLHERRAAELHRDAAVAGPDGPDKVRRGGEEERAVHPQLYVDGQGLRRDGAVRAVQPDEEA
jgi:hypothetical protein